ncbi:MAG: ABC transporter substrate-binding protein [Bacteroidales bacterium]|nr:ABC transporter substrate-binding protein [Bacteroidales bacterium]
MHTYFYPADSLFTITENYPETLDVFVRQGFAQLADAEKRASFGKALRLDIALSMRQIDYDAFEKLLLAAIEGHANNKQITDSSRLIRVKGLLPCPVRIPLQEKLELFIESCAVEGIQLDAQMKAASMGLDWISSEVEAATTADELDDIYMSAGFDMFFEERFFKRFTRDGSFVNPISWDRINPLFHNDKIDLRDPEGKHGIVAVVPAVFLVNTDMLDGRPIPDSWLSLCDPMYERSISLPVSDFDLFNAILLTMKQRYGDSSVAALGRNMLKSLHPAQMVRSERQKTEKPAITIMPNFFTQMVREGSRMKAVWPNDGAIISPVFMIGKKAKGATMQAVADFFAGKEVAEILSHQGLFPSLHPEVDNRLPNTRQFMWLGWDYILNHNLNQEFDACQKLFDEAQLR